MAAAVTATGFAGAAMAQASDEPDGFPGTPAAALKMMMRGNERWVRGKARHPHQPVRWREHAAPHQEPFATVFSRIDSRVPPELVFDRGLGDFIVDIPRPTPSARSQLGTRRAGQTPPSTASCPRAGMPQATIRRSRNEGVLAE